MADYNAVEKGKCAQEFLKLKDCYLVSKLPCMNCAQNLTNERNAEMKAPQKEVSI